jgi:peptidyl-tRNA hydrolase, PTH1 family
MPWSGPYALLITSIGNPSRAQHLRAPPFKPSRLHAHGLMTSYGPYTLWQSPTLMNVSGPAVRNAWRTFVKEHPSPPADVGPGPRPALGLIVLHDDLESAPGTIKVRRGMGGSVKGHNGLKSVMNSLRAEPLLQAKSGGMLVRVGIGIGRPPKGGRGRSVVTDYVLGTCTVPEREGIERLVEKVLEVCDEEGERITYVR